MVYLAKVLSGNVAFCGLSGVQVNTWNKEKKTKILTWWLESQTQNIPESSLIQGTCEAGQFGPGEFCSFLLLDKGVWVNTIHGITQVYQWREIWEGPLGRGTRRRKREGEAGLFCSSGQLCLYGVVAPHAWGKKNKHQLAGKIPPWIFFLSSFLHFIFRFWFFRWRMALLWGWYKEADLYFHVDKDRRCHICPTYKTFQWRRLIQECQWPPEGQSSSQGSWMNITFLRLPVLPGHVIEEAWHDNQTWVENVSHDV